MLIQVMLIFFQVPEEIFTDDYFKANLPASYGSVSQSPPIEDEYNPMESMFGSEAKQCSKGFQELSRNLGALGGKRSVLTLFYSH